MTETMLLEAPRCTDPCVLRPAEPNERRLGQEVLNWIPYLVGASLQLYALYVVLS